jgi:hypothetical protein
MAKAVIADPMALANDALDERTLTVEPAKLRGVLAGQEKRRRYALFPEDIEHRLGGGRGTVVVGEEDVSRQGRL